MQFASTGNRMLLWHGSRLSNWAGILSQGNSCYLQLFLLPLLSILIEDGFTQLSRFMSYCLLNILLPYQHMGFMHSQKYQYIFINMDLMLCWSEALLHNCKLALSIFSCV
jgi:hypothetical protein